MGTAVDEFAVLLTGGEVAGEAYEVRLPVGMPLLNANGRGHWRSNAATTAVIRSTAALAARTTPVLRRAMLAARGRPVMSRAHVLAVLHPTDRRRRDPANWYPSVKAAVDGLVDAGVLEDDDYTRVVGPDMRLGDPVRGGQLALWVHPLGAS